MFSQFTIEIIIRKTTLHFVVDCKVGNAADYRGHIDQTVMGDTCMSWSDLSFGPPSYNFIDGSADLAGNYCRNPDNDDRAWCVNAPGGPWHENVNWGYCDIPDC